jgi:hypothetical protein
LRWWTLDDGRLRLGASTFLILRRGTESVGAFHNGLGVAVSRYWSTVTTAAAHLQVCVATMTLRPRSLQAKDGRRGGCILLVEINDEKLQQSSHVMKKTLATAFQPDPSLYLSNGFLPRPIFDIFSRLRDFQVDRHVDTVFPSVEPCNIHNFIGRYLPRRCRC